jgi:hypothetical protein
MAKEVPKIAPRIGPTSVAAPPIKAIPSLPLREGARAPQVVTPANIPITIRPVSVTKKK